MTVDSKVEIIRTYIKNTYNRELDIGYIKYAVMFSFADKDKKNLEVHHIVPRTCGGRNDIENLISITKKHHTKLHNLILKSDSLSDEERTHLEYAYLKRTGRIK